MSLVQGEEFWVVGAGYGGGVWGRGMGAGSGGGVWPLGEGSSRTAPVEG